MTKAKKDIIKLKGKVKKCLPGTKFIVKTEEHGLEVTCGISGKLRQNKIKILEHDSVEIEISVYDFNTGRIVWRF